MTVQSDLKAAIDAYIQSSFAGTLSEVSASNLNLSQLLEISQMAGESGSGIVIPAFTLGAINLGAANAGVSKASAGAVYSIKVTNKNAAVRYFQIVNKATTPTNSDSALIVDVVGIPSNSTVIIDSSYFGATGLVCSTGVSWAFSSTDTTITLATAGDVISTVGYL
jgi:hypothetical protein